MQKMRFSHSVHIVLLLLCQIVGLMLFLRGFFPLKKAIEGRATNDNLPPEPLFEGKGDPLPPKFGRVVIMLIDALRADFVYSEQTRMPFTQELIRLNKSFSFMAKAHPPTVTMPRIKVDNNVTRHIGKELRSTDWDIMILHYLGLDHIGHIAGPSSPLVGPKLLEMDQVVSDIYNEMLHWHQQRKVPSLLVLCGDHGMSEVGSHGGASLVETITPLVFMSPLFENGGGEEFAMKQVQQIDLVPTLSLLLGLPVPQNSLGILLPELFGFHKPREKLRAMQLNSHQLSQVLIANGHSVDNIWELQHAHKLHSDWLQSAEIDPNATRNQITVATKVAKQYILALQKMSGHVTASLSNYDLHAMIYGIAVLVQTLYWFVCGLLQLSFEMQTRDKMNFLMTNIIVVSGAVLLAAILHLSTCSSTVFGGSDILCSVSSLESMVYSILCALLSGVTLASVLNGLSRFLLSSQSFISQFISALPSLFQKNTRSFLVIGVFLHVVSLYSSSFVEEEHQTWYLLISTLFVVIFLEKIASGCHEKNFSDTEFHNSFRIQEESSDEEKAHKWELYSNLRNASSHRNSQHSSISGAPNADGLCSTTQDDDRIRTGTENAITYRDLSQSDSTSTVSGNHIDRKTDLEQETITFKKKILRQLLLCFVLLASGRVSRSWNQTGIKWADRPDIGDWLVKPYNRVALSLCYFVSVLFIIGFRYSRQNVLTTVVSIVGAVSAYVYRTVTGSLQLPWIPNGPITKGILAARVTYCCVAIIVIGNIINLCRIDRNTVKRRTFQEYIFDVCGSLEGILTALLLLQILLQRPHNITLLAVFVVQEHIFRKLFWKSLDNTWLIVLSSLWIGHAMYFSLGNSNSLASVDISAGYVGLEEHIPVIVGPLTCIATYCGLLLWLMAAVLSIVRNAQEVKRLQYSLHQVCYVISLCQALVLCAYCTLVFVQRYHLFVWSVFSPKLLYEAMKTLLLTLCVVVVLCLTAFVGRAKRIYPKKPD
ncbi:GPI ethanolamine phosphate transferase 2-like isoform X2 [Stylophora pistillata]|uniref:GPI ethanolamine phosphate transferase 2-like isoform X2 n=1 Tax=Stylophora pistillata TaxID=50429 RepID=UPI000C04FFAA|nr:GPI ethanolamine phosphate transferase 2-like isoform X2 [Stylophora pistillata]